MEIITKINMINKNERTCIPGFASRNSVKLPLLHELYSQPILSTNTTLFFTTRFDAILETIEVNVSHTSSTITGTDHY